MKRKLLSVLAITVVFVLCISGCGEEERGRERDRDRDRERDREERLDDEEEEAEEKENSGIQSGENTGAKEDGKPDDDAELPRQDDVWDENRAWTGRDDILPHEENGYIVFGAYEQDGDPTNGPEPIEWEVLGSDGNGTLLISRYVLDAQRYNETDTDVTWETCTLRQWLNNDFINKAFTASEQGCISNTTISNSDNPSYGTPGGNATTDQVFVLSVDEILSHYSFETWYDDDMYGLSSALITPPTEYAKNTVGWRTIDQGDYDNYLTDSGYGADVIGKESAGWWLRSPGNFGDFTCSVDHRGTAGWIHISRVDGFNIGVRPALYVTQ